MPSSHLPPEEQAKVKLFNPLVLDRTVIAVPLLRDMEEDLRLIEQVKKRRPEQARTSNTAIEFNRDFRGGVKHARKRVEEMIKVATRETLATASRRVADARKEVKESEEKRHRALEKAIQKPVIGSIQTDDQKTYYSFARCTRPSSGVCWPTTSGSPRRSRPSCGFIPRVSRSSSISTWNIRAAAKRRGNG